MNDYQLLKFHAPWCAPCKMMSPVIEKVATGFGISTQSINVDESPAEATQWGVRSLPTIIVTKNGGEVFRQTGATSADKLEAAIREVL
jgi:thioredoxin 1